MYRLLIADDEPLERKGVKVIVEKYVEEVEVIAEARNGREAIELCEIHRPDIVFLDIKMPGIDGIEAAKEIKKINPAIEIVIFTAYDYFEYARESLKIGIFDYILKPARRNVLIETLQKIKQKIDKQRKDRYEKLKMREELYGARSVIEKRIASIIFEGLIEEDEEIKKELNMLNIEFHSYGIMAIRCDDSNNATELRKYLYDKYEGCEDFLVSIYQNTVFLIMIYDIEDEINLQESTMEKAKSLKEKILKRFDFYMSFGSSIGKGTEEIRNSLRYAKNATQNDSKGVVFASKDMLIETESIEEISSAIKLVEKFEASDLAEIDKRYLKIENFIRTKYDENSLFEIHEILVLLRSNLYKTKNKIYFSESIKLVQDKKSREEVINMLKHDFLKYKSSLEKSEDKLIDISKEYIEENYKSEITLDKIAMKFAISPHYYSKLFKQETGMNFIEFLTKIRIDKAKEMLKEGRSIKEITKEVGYNDRNYFSRVFKRITGLRPSEYK